MCLPGTIETVREQTEREGVSRRALLAGGGAAAVAVAFPGAAEARKRHGKRRGGHGGKPHFGKVTDLTHLFRAGFPVYTGAEPSRTHAQELRPRRLLLAGVDLRRALGHPRRRARALRPRRSPRAPAEPRRSARPGGRHRHHRARRLEPRRRGGAARPAALRAPSRPHPARRGRADELGLGREGQRQRGVQERRLGGVYHFPGFGIDAVEALLERRDIRGIGVDTLSLDPGNSTTFAVHKRLLGAHRYGIENVANLSALRPKGAYVSVGVVPWEEGSGGPCRLLAYG